MNDDVKRSIHNIRGGRGRSGVGRKTYDQPTRAKKTDHDREQARDNMSERLHGQGVDSNEAHQKSAELAREHERKNG